MQRYVLTERGKLLIAILIVIFLILPSIIIVVMVSNRDNAADLKASDPDPENTPGLAQYLPPLTGPIAFDSEAGMMAFLFTPGSQSALDEESLSMIGELLKSPQNTTASILTVEIPLLSDEETAVVTGAVVDAFSSYEVPLSKIVFYIYHPEPNIKTYEISLKFS